MHDQEEEDIFLKINVDTPTALAPLEEAYFAGKIITEEEKLAMAKEKKRLIEQ